jgi:AGZA family xanthine/uracil permease-like MFS transporter
VFFQSFILMIGGFIAPYIRRITPRAALLGTLAGVSVTFISMRPALEMYMTPIIGIPCFAIILVAWFILYWFGIIALLLSLVPVVAISPILLYIGMLIGAQAFQETPKSHAPAVVLALVPHLAAWCKTLMDGALQAAGTNAHAVGLDKLAQVGVLYQGLEVLGGGAILTGLVFGAVGAFIIDRKFLAAAAFAGAGALLTFFGFMHGESVGIAVTPVVATAYAIVAIFLLGLSRTVIAIVTPAQAPHATTAPAE